VTVKENDQARAISNHPFLMPWEQRHCPFLPHSLKFDQPRGCNGGYSGHSWSTASVPPIAASIQRYTVPAATAATGGQHCLSRIHRANSAVGGFEGLGDVSDYEPPIPTGVIVNSLQNTGLPWSWVLSQRHTQNIVRQQYGFGRLKSAAQTVTVALGTQSQLYGWHMFPIPSKPSIGILN